jgi:hypothetical protein
LIQSRICCSRFSSRAACFPRYPGGSNPWSSADFARLRGHSIQMLSPTHWLTVEDCAAVLRFREHRRPSGIGIRFFDQSRLFGGYYRGFLGCKIRGGVARGFRVVARALRPFHATLSRVKSHGRIPCQTIRCFGLPLWFSRRQLQIAQNWIWFRIVSCHIHSHAPLKFWVKAAFLFGGIGEYQALSGLYHNLMWILILLTLFLLFSQIYVLFCWGHSKISSDMIVVKFFWVSAIWNMTTISCTIVLSAWHIDDIGTLTANASIHSIEIKVDIS